jgi:hypothetical protein
MFDNLSLKINSSARKQTAIIMYQVSKNNDAITRNKNYYLYNQGQYVSAVLERETEGLVHAKWGGGVTRTDRESGRIVKHCRIDNKT